MMGMIQLRHTKELRMQSQPIVTTSDNELATLPDIEEVQASVWCDIRLFTSTCILQIKFRIDPRRSAHR
jgi:hypothetical protein